MRNSTDTGGSRQGNYCKKQEKKWEQEKLIGLAKEINRHPIWGREFLKKLEFKHSKEYVQKIKDAANKEREKLLKGRQFTQFRR